MTIDKAIEILTAERICFPTSHTPDLNDALQLGIEALKAVKDSRFDPSTYVPHLLPGETSRKEKRR